MGACTDSPHPYSAPVVTDHGSLLALTADFDLNFAGAIAQVVTMAAVSAPVGTELPGTQDGGGVLPDAPMEGGDDGDVLGGGPEGGGPDGGEVPGQGDTQGDTVQGGGGGENGGFADDGGGGSGGGAAGGGGGGSLPFTGFAAMGVAAAGAALTTAGVTVRQMLRRRS